MQQAHLVDIFSHLNKLQQQGSANELHKDLAYINLVTEDRFLYKRDFELTKFKQKMSDTSNSETSADRSKYK